MCPGPRKLIHSEHSSDFEPNCHHDCGFYFNVEYFEIILKIKKRNKLFAVKLNFAGCFQTYIIL